ncbi:MAG: hypothetical protein JO114_00465 [Planctomycetaceae bacterium]|nr:hypothetical protein [Planctomycetaceae bacterium]
MRWPRSAGSHASSGVWRSPSWSPRGCSTLIWSGWRGYRSARQFVAGLDYIALGMLSFALAWLTSLVKGGKLSPRIAGSEGKLRALGD